MFEDTPEEWIQYDLLGHDDDTQRSHSSKLANEVAKVFPEETQALLGRLKGMIVDPFLAAE